MCVYPGRKKKVRCARVCPGRKERRGVCVARGVCVCPGREKRGVCAARGVYVRVCPGKEQRGEGRRYDLDREETRACVDERA